MPSCNCRKDIEKRLTEMFQNTTPGSDHRVSLTGFSLLITDRGIEERPAMPYDTSVLVPLKKGGTKWKNSSGVMVFSYCPWCGVSLSADASTAASAKEGEVPA